MKYGHSMGHVIRQVYIGKCTFQKDNVHSKTLEHSNNSKQNLVIHETLTDIWIKQYFRQTASREVKANTTYLDQNNVIESLKQRDVIDDCSVYEQLQKLQHCPADNVDHKALLFSNINANIIVRAAKNTHCMT
ncbi:hypothetical protein GJ496_011646 [Pomphorhynchus laevis]|nr:hypothetical protein GJ496_011646 [Pomphorhynchus laevis]